MSDGRVVSFEVDGKAMSAELFVPTSGTPIGLLLGHGAGGDRRAPLLRALGATLQASGRAVALYNFPYTEAGRKAPDRGPVLERAAVAAAAELRTPLGVRSLVLGGKSMGGRIAAQVVASGQLEQVVDVRGLVFLGFPLHAAGKDDQWERRAATIRRLPPALPLLFVQGTRDRLCRLDLLERAASGPGGIGADARARTRVRIHVIPDGDHSLALPRRSGRSPEDVVAEVTGVIAGWMDEIV